MCQLMARNQGVFRWAVLFALLPLCATARVDISPRPAPGQSRAWTGGAVVFTQDFCVLSTQSPQPGATDTIPYRVEVAGPFELENGTGSIPAQLEWVDLSTAQASTLTPDVPTAEVMSGQLNNCPGGDNGRLRITLSEADILAAGAGTFAQAYSLEVSNSGQGNSQRKGSLEIELVVPDWILISEIDDIDLGTYSGADLQASDSVCIYQTSGSTYAISAFGEGGSGAFVISNGNVSLPMQLVWDDGVTRESLAPGVVLSGRTQSNSQSVDCYGGSANNAILEVTINESDILADGIVAGGYAGTLTLMIEQE